MTRKTTRRTTAVTGRNPGPVSVQRKINQDYSILVKDYGKLFSEIWKKPVTKYILGGIALTSMIPLAMKFYRSSDVFKKETNLDGDASRVDGGVMATEINDFDSMNV